MITKEEMRKKRKSIENKEKSLNPLKIQGFLVAEKEGFEPYHILVIAVLFIIVSILVSIFAPILF